MAGIQTHTSWVVPARVLLRMLLTDFGFVCVFSFIVSFFPSHQFFLWKLLPTSFQNNNKNCWQQPTSAKNFFLSCHLGWLLFVILSQWQGCKQLYEVAAPGTNLGNQLFWQLKYWVICSQRMLLEWLAIKLKMLQWRGGRLHGKEVAFVLLTHQPWVKIFASMLLE